MTSPEHPPGRPIYTTADLAAELHCSTRKVRKAAATLGIGINLAGSAGFRYTEAEREQLHASMRPGREPAVTPRRKRRRAA